MSTNKQKEQREALGNMADGIVGKFRRFEILFVLATAVGLILKLLGIPGSSMLIIFSMTILAMMYFFHAFVTGGDEQIDAKGRFVIKLASYSSAVGVLGIVFMLYRYPGANMMVLVGIIGMVVTLPLVVMKWMQNKASKIFNPRLIVRLAIILSICLILYFIPDHLLVESGLIS